MLDSPKLKFGLNETRLGLVPPKWLSALAAQTVGERIAENLLQRGLMLDPQRSLEVGYVDELAADESELEEKVNAAIQEMTMGVGAGARAETKLNQRRAVLELSGAHSVDYMEQFVLGEEFQSMAGQMLLNLKKKKKK